MRLLVDLIKSVSIFLFIKIQNQGIAFKKMTIIEKTKLRVATAPNVKNGVVGPTANFAGESRVLKVLEESLVRWGESIGIDAPLGG